MRSEINLSPWSSALGMVLGASLATAMPYLAAEPQPRDESSAMAQRPPPHLACIRALEATLKLEPAATEAIGRNDLAGLTRLHEEIESRLRTARADMDRAFLTGAWKSPAKRQRAAELLGQMEGVQMLNFIGLAFLKGYDHPTRKVSLSIRDANQKMFVQLGQLSGALDAFDREADSNAGRGR